MSLDNLGPGRPVVQTKKSQGVGDLSKVPQLGSELEGIHLRKENVLELEEHTETTELYTLRVSFLIM